MANPLLIFTPEKYEELEEQQKQQAVDTDNPLLMFDEPKRDGGFTMPLPSSAYTRAAGLPTSVQVPGWVSWLMRQLMRGESAMVAPLLDIHQTVQDVRAGDATQLDYLKSLGRVPQRMWEGLVADEPHSYYELLDQMFPNMPDWLKVVGSLPLSIYGDPLGYMTFFKRAADGKRVALQLGGRTVIEGDRLVRAVEGLVQATKDTPLGREFMQKFSRHIGPEGYAAFRDDFIDLMQYRIAKAQEQGMDFYKAVQQVSEETGLTPGEISQLWERPVVTRTEPRQVVEQVPVDRTVRDVTLGGEALPTPPRGEVLREAIKHLELPTEPTIYKVQRGDTLTDIARRHFVTVEEIVEANPQLKDPNRIRTNQNLTIPVPSHVKTFYKQTQDLRLLQEWHIAQELDLMRYEMFQAEPGRRILTEGGTWLAEPSTYPEWWRTMATTTKSRQNVLRTLDKLLEERTAERLLDPEAVKDLLSGKTYRSRSKLADELWETAHDRLLHGSREQYYYPADPNPVYREIMQLQDEAVEQLQRAATATEREQVIRTLEQRIRTELAEVRVPVLAEAPREVRELVYEMREWNEAAARRLEEAGIRITRFEHDDIEYLAHRITPEARDIITGQKDAAQWGEAQVRRTMDWDVRDRHGNMRQIRDMTIQEANEAFMKEHGVPLFIDDPAIATTMRVISAEKAATSAEFLQGVTQNPDWARRVHYRVKEGDTLASIAEEVGTSVDDLVRMNPDLGRLRPSAEGRVQTGIAEFMGDVQPRQHNVDMLRVGDAPADWRRVEGKRFGDFTDEFAFHPEIAKDLEGFIRIVDPDELNVFLSLYDQYMNLWKLNALAWYPGYHTRNLVGNMLNNHAAGVKSVQVYDDALKAWLKRPGGRIELPNEVVLPDGRATKVLTYEDLAELAARHGARGRGQYASVSDMVEGAGFGQRTPLSPFRIGGRAPSDYMFMIQEAQEDWTRMAHFLDRLKKGDTPRQAAQSVKKYLFDYTQHGLTEFERTTMRRLVPFYVWSRNNLPLQLELLFTQPGYAAGRAKLYRGIEQLFGDDVEGVDPRYLDSFIAGGMPIRVGSSAEGQPRYWRSLYWDPFSDLSQLSTGEEFGRFAGSMLTPPLQAAIEAMTGRTLHFGGDVERYPGQIATVPGLPDVPMESRWLNPLLTLVPGTRALYEIQRTNPFRLVDPDDPRSAGERALGAVGIRTYARDPEIEAYWARSEWRDSLSGMLRDYRRQDGPRAKAAVFRQVQTHLAKEDLAEWDMQDIRRLVDDIQGQIRSAAMAGDHEHIRFLEDVLHDVLQRI